MSDSQQPSTWNMGVAETLWWPFVFPLLAAASARPALTATRPETQAPTTWIALHRGPDRPMMVNMAAALTMERTADGLTRIVFPETGDDADSVLLVTETVDEVRAAIAAARGRQA